MLDPSSQHRPNGSQKSDEDLKSWLSAVMSAAQEPLPDSSDINHPEHPNHFLHRLDIPENQRELLAILKNREPAYYRDTGWRIRAIRALTKQPLNGEMAGLLIDEIMGDKLLDKPAYLTRANSRRTQGQLLETAGKVALAGMRDFIEGVTEQQTTPAEIESPDSPRRESAFTRGLPGISDAVKQVKKLVWSSEVSPRLPRMMFYLAASGSAEAQSLLRAVARNQAMKPPITERPRYTPLQTYGVAIPFIAGTAVAIYMQDLPVLLTVGLGTLINAGTSWFTAKRRWRPIDNPKVSRLAARALWLFQPTPDTDS